MPLFAPADLTKLEARHDVKGLIRMLAEDRFSVHRRDAAKALGQLGDAKALRGLVEALHDPDVHVRDAAAGALGRLGDVRAVEPLIAALFDGDGTVWHAAASALGKLRDPRAFESLMGILRNPRTVGDLAMAIEALGATGDARAVDRLVPFLRDTRGGVNHEAAFALDKLGWTPDSEHAAVYAIAKRDWEGCVKVGAAAVEPLIATLASPFRGDRQAAAETLGRIRDRRALEPLLRSLHDEDGPVARAAAAALDDVGWNPVGMEAEATYCVVKGDWRRCAEIGAAAIDPLIATLCGSGPVSVKRSAAEVLVEIYHSGKLDPASKQKILAQRATITFREPEPDDWDEERYGKPPALPEDRSIGVAFPLETPPRGR